MSRFAVQLERDHALLDAQIMAEEYGMEVYFRLRGESEVVRDKYHSLKSSSTSEGLVNKMYALPVEFSPNQKALMEAGLKNECDVIITTPLKSWDDIGVGYDQIDMTRATVNLQGVKYRIREKTRTSHFFDTFLYYTFGLKRE